MTTIIRAVRYHDISCGHRVVGHENKCRGLHGHNYRIHFHCQAAELDSLGRVVDFGVIKDKLCSWLEDNWDHKMLLWEKDPVYTILLAERIRKAYARRDLTAGEVESLAALSSLCAVPFNPTAENMGAHLLGLGAILLDGTDCTLTKVVIEETRKCSVEVESAQFSTPTA